MNRRDAIKALMVGIPATATISAAKVEPDDVLVIETDEYLSQSSIARLGDCVQRVWPGRKCLVLDHGIKLKIAKAQP